MTPNGKTYIDAKIENLEDEVERLRTFRDATEKYVEFIREFLIVEVRDRAQSQDARFRKLETGVDTLERLEIARSARYGAYGTIGGVAWTLIWEVYLKRLLTGG